MSQRRVGRWAAAATAATAVQALPVGVWSVGRHDRRLCGLVLAAMGWDMGEGWVAIRSATLSCGFSKTSFLLYRSKMVESSVNLYILMFLVISIPFSILDYNTTKDLVVAKYDYRLVRVLSFKSVQALL